MKYTWIIIFLGFVDYLHGQSFIHITFKDSITQEAIPNLYVEDIQRKAGDFTQLNGKIKLRHDGRPLSLLVTHISYGQIYLDLKDLKDQSIFLKPISIDIKEIVVTDVRRDVESALTKVIKTRREDKKVWKHDYAFYLETSYNHKQFEKIKAVFDAQYTEQNGLVENQLIDGEFWFNPDSLFINLDLDEWLGSFTPFASKDKTDRQYILTNAGSLKKSSHKVTLLECAQCENGNELFQIEGDRQTVLILANLETKKVQQYHLTWKPNSNGHFKNLISGDTTKIESLEMQYFFNDGDLQKLYFNVKLNDRLNRKLIVRGFFSQVNYVKERKLYYIGSYRPKTLYERIIMDPAPDHYRIDTLFKQESFEGYSISKTDGLWSNDESIRNYFYNHGTFSKGIILWNPQHENSAKMATIYLAESGFRYSMENNTALVPDITWIYSHHQTDNQWKSIPSIWSKKSSKIFNCKDTTYLTLAMGMAFDLYELERQNLIPKDINHISTHFSTQSQMINKEMNAVIQDRASAIYLYRQNKMLYDKWKIDHLTSAFEREAHAIVKYDKYQPLVNKFAESAHHYQGQYDNEVSAGMSRMVVGFYDQFLQQSFSQLTFKKKGSIFSILADQYYLLGNQEMACSYFKSALKEWPEANKAYPKLHLMKLCAIK